MYAHPRRRRLHQGPHLAQLQQQQLGMHTSKTRAGRQLALAHVCAHLNLTSRGPPHWHATPFTSSHRWISRHARSLTAGGGQGMGCVGWDSGFRPGPAGPAAGTAPSASACCCTADRYLRGRATSHSNAGSLPHPSLRLAGPTPQQGEAPQSGSQGERSPALWMATTAAMSSSAGVHPLRFMAL